MPHQCTNCNQTFPDGSKEMLSGCPGCGGNKFQYLPQDSSATASDDEPPEPLDPSGPSGSVTEKMARAATTVEDYVAQRRTDESMFDDDSRDSDTESAEVEARSSGQVPSETGEFEDAVEPSREDQDEEDTAQASARGSIVDESDLPRESTTESKPESSPPPSDGQVVKEPTTDSRPDLESLRSELNDQFESIRIVEPGQYELNLMELYDRQEYIISLKEDGKYVVEIPEGWDDDDDSEET